MIPILRTPLKLPLALFLASAVIGLWASYDQVASQEKLILIILAVLVFGILANLRGMMRTATVWGGLTLAATFSIYFVSQHDFAGDPAKLQVITSFGELVNEISPQFGFHVPQPNIAAGALEMALPFGVALGWQRLKDRKWIELIAAFLLSAAIGLGLIMTSSRGAWLTLVLVSSGFILFLLARKNLILFHLSNRLLVPLLLDFALVGFLILLRFWDSGRLLEYVGAISTGSSSISRLEVYRSSLHLIQDYTFTGSGLGVFPMVFSTYALMIDVPYLTHSHDMFLQVWIEQGLLGIVAFLWLTLAFYFWVWRRRDQMNWIAVAGLFSMTALLIHGFVDVLFYSSRFLPLMFLPMGLAVAGLRPRKGLPLRYTVTEYKVGIAVGTVALLALVIVAIATRDQIASIWYSNLGSVEQTRVELARYHFSDSLVEYVRHDADLSEPVNLFMRALLHDPENVTANQRLASIALARQDYASALSLGLAAEERDSQNSITRELLGEAYLSTGQSQEAFTYWSSFGDAPSRLERLAFVRFRRLGDKQREGWANALAVRIRSTANQ